MDLGFRERVAIVGGSSKGVGRAIALALAKEGASVTICSRDEGELRQAEIEIARSSTQHHVLAIPADLSRDDDIKRVVRSTFNRFGRIDIAVNNVGIPPVGRPSELGDGEWEEALERNFFSVVRMSRQVVPYMKQQHWGRIVNRLSILVTKPSEGMGLSASSPMGVVGYARMLATELAPFNITVNNVLAGYIQTDQLSSFYRHRARETGGSAEEMMREAARLVPMGRLGRPEDVGDVVAFLASERAGYITGENVVLDGGAVKATL